MNINHITTKITQDRTQTRSTIPKHIVDVCKINKQDEIEWRFIGGKLNARLIKFNPYKHRNKPMIFKDSVKTKMRKHANEEWVKDILLRTGIVPTHSDALAFTSGFNSAYNYLNNIRKNDEKYEFKFTDNIKNKIMNESCGKWLKGINNKFGVEPSSRDTIMYSDGFSICFDKIDDRCGGKLTNVLITNS